MTDPEYLADATSLLFDLRALFWDGPSAKERVKVSVRQTTVTVVVHDNSTVNYALFKGMSMFLRTENIDAEKESGEHRISEVTSESWSNVTFTAYDVPKYLVAALSAALLAEATGK